MAIRSKEAQGDLADAEFDVAFDFVDAVELVTVYVQADVAITEDVEVWFDSAAGDAFDTLIDSRTLTTNKSYVFAANGEIALNEGDKIRVKVTNANEEGVVSVTVKARNYA